jgi:hypothetical protein
MRLTRGQVAWLASAGLVLAAPPASAGEEVEVTTARRFLEALDGGSLTSAQNNASPQFAAEVAPLMVERKSRGYGGLWTGAMGGRTVETVTPTRVPNRSLVRFTTRYETATLSQEVVVQCDGRCAVVAFREAPQTGKQAY